MSPISLILPSRASFWAVRTWVTESVSPAELDPATTRMAGKALSTVAPFAMNRSTCGGRPCSTQSASNRSKTFVSSARSSAGGREVGAICARAGHAIGSVQGGDRLRKGARERTRARLYHGQPGSIVCPCER